MVVLIRPQKMKVGKAQASENENERKRHARQPVRIYCRRALHNSKAKVSPDPNRVAETPFETECLPYAGV
jgi:hypothetical protein